MKAATKNNAAGKWLCPYCGGKMWKGRYESHIRCHNYACTDKDDWCYTELGVPISNDYPSKKGKNVIKGPQPVPKQHLCTICHSPTHFCDSAADAAICKYREAQEHKQRIGAAEPVSYAVKVDDILEERGSRYGSFADNARISQRLEDVFREECELRVKRGQLPLTYYQREAIEMIFAKICRIVSGDAEYADNWDDIAGYAQLGKNPR